MGVTRRAGLLLALFVLAASCTSGKDAEPERKAAQCAVRGELLAMTGTVDPDRLTRITLCPFRVETIVAGGSFSVVAAAGDVALASGSHPTPDIDTIRRVVDGQLLPLPAIGESSAFAPAVNTNGNVAFIRGRPGDGERHNVALLDNAADPTPETIYVIPGDSTSLFWSGDRLHLLEVPGGAPTQRGSEADAVVRTLWPPEAKAESRSIRVKWPAGLTAGPEGRLAVLHNILRETAEGAVIDASGRSIALPAGWYPLAFAGPSPDLLVAKYHTAEVGVVSPPDYASVKILGKSPVGRVWYADWVD